MSKKLFPLSLTQNVAGSFCRLTAGNNDQLLIIQSVNGWNINLEMGLKQYLCPTTNTFGRLN